MSMNTIFRWILETSWQGAVVALLILAAQRALGRRLSAGWRYGLWFLLIARLVAPSLPESRASVYNLAKAKTPLERTTGAWPRLDETPPATRAEDANVDVGGAENSAAKSAALSEVSYGPKEKGSTDWFEAASR
jgi:bla regulator protein BlaR1